MKWTKHTAVMMSNLQSALRTQRHTDLDIRCGSNIFSVHKVIVCAFSRHLDSLCTDDPSLATIRIEEDADVGPKMLSALLEFIYAGEVTVDESHVETLLKAAKKLRIIGLVSEESIRKEEESRERNSRKRKVEEDNNRGGGPAPSTSSAASSSCGGVQVKSEPADLEEDSTSDIAVPPMPPLKMAPDIVLKEEEDLALRFGADNSIVAIDVDQAIVDEIVNELEDPEVPLNDFSRIDFRKKEKGFHCKLCRKSFDRLNTLKRHLHTHLGSRMYRCNLCSKTLSNEDEVSLHLRASH